MSDSERIFLDSNILVYLIDIRTDKHHTAEKFLSPNQFISTQVIAENVNVCLKKFKLSKEKSFQHGQFLMDNFSVVTIGQNTLASAFKISAKYNLSFWDSLIISSALENHCTILYSEDLQEGQLIENKLTIINPFKIY